MIGRKTIKLLNYFEKEIRYFTTKFQCSYDDSDKKSISKSDLEWQNALPYEKIPGPTKLSLIQGFLPRGKYYKKQLKELQISMHNEFGDIVRMPGVFGKRDLILTFDPVDYETIFRTEGPSPIRRGLDAIDYYRKVKRPDIFSGAGGLISEQGDEWYNFRKVVNTVMMQTQSIRMYIPRMDKVANQFVERIRLIRDPITNEVPSTFENNINLWALESIGVVALDTELGLICENNKTPEAIRLINAMASFFQLSYELDIKPSFWKIIKTPKFYKMMNSLETITEITIKYIENALEKMNTQQMNSDGEKSILEKLLKVDKKIAIVMAMDLMFGGVDSTTTAYVGCLLGLAKNPQKQEILRMELRKILPEKDSPLTNENMKNLPYLKACIKEGIRMYPVTAGNLRTTGHDIVLKGYRIPKDIDMAMPNVLLHKDNKHFSNSNQYIPERWLRTNHTKKQNDNITMNNSVAATKPVNPFAYVPFGFGPRSCIGRRLVDIEMEIGLAKIIRNFHVEFNYPDDNIFKTNLINVPNAELKFKFTDIE